MADEAPRRTCGTHDVHLRLMASDPNYRANRARIENYALEYARTRGAIQRTGVTVIPVVVHVVHNTAAQNISDAQINSRSTSSTRTTAKPTRISPAYRGSSRPSPPTLASSSNWRTRTPRTTQPMELPVPARQPLRSVMTTR